MGRLVSLIVNAPAPAWAVRWVFREHSKRLHRTADMLLSCGEAGTYQLACKVRSAAHELDSLANVPAVAPATLDSTSPDDVMAG